MTPVQQSINSIGKLASEHYMDIYKHVGVIFIALRLFNVYGPGQNMNNPRQGMVSVFRTKPSGMVK